jgi:hypothetical protein
MTRLTAALLLLLLLLLALALVPVGAWGGTYYLDPTNDGTLESWTADTTTTHSGFGSTQWVRCGFPGDNATGLDGENATKIDIRQDVLK